MGRRKKIPYAMSRRRKNGLLLFWLFLVPAGLGVLDHRFGGPLRSTIQKHFFYSPDQKRFHLQTFAVTEVIDGDTLDIRTDSGEVVRVRLLGVDTPETKHPTVGVMYFGPEASDFVRKLIGAGPVTLLLDNVGDQRDLYGRLLAYVRLEDGRIVNEEIIRNGWGYADLRFEHSRFAQYEKWMEEAREEKRGLWKEVRREQLPQWLRDKQPLLLR
ncbi:MAG TPA: thermonuclease family protein [Anaerohalosphaeraceae bacterium]|nr:thermonuclease family protein [Anaerohalosphaeraceae bacterium]HOL89143.1 thermonuclease family protein [Anaerohalosphaeraceae bacterium]HPP56334.1 thermonuclease family protein [Anaerohalosphaeraceae bacterium]